MAARWDAAWLQRKGILRSLRLASLQSTVLALIPLRSFETTPPRIDTCGGEPDATTYLRAPVYTCCMLCELCLLRPVRLCHVSRARGHARGPDGPFCGSEVK